MSAEGPWDYDLFETYFAVWEETFPHFARGQIVTKSSTLVENFMFFCVTHNFHL